MIPTLSARRAGPRPVAFWAGAAVLAAGFLFGSSGAFAAAPPANTIIGNQASASYLDPAGASQLATSNLVQTTVQQVGINNQAKSGETVEYRITYTNNGDAPVRSMTVNDTTPGYTSFVSATTGATPATLTACAKNTPANALPAAAVPCAAAQPVGGTGPIEWRFVGSVDPGGTGTVLFQVKVD